MNLLFFIGMVLFFYSTYLTTRAKYYAWNMPEAYEPAIWGGLLSFVSGLVIGISFILEIK